MSRESVSIILLLTLSTILKNTIHVSASPSIIDTVFSEVENQVMNILEKLFLMALNIMRVAYMVLAAIGVLFWTTGFEPLRGKRLLISALILAVAVEYLSSININF